MLDVCAPGYRRKQREHNWCVMYAGKTYHRLPLGEHGKRADPEVKLGHVKQMVRQLGIEDCAKREIPQLLG